MLKKWIVFVGAILLSNVLLAQNNLTKQLIDSAQYKYLHVKGTDEMVKTGFFIADNYMDISAYDTAQIWLNKISFIYNNKDASLFNYYLESRQAEVYYYNGLLQMGLQSALESFQIAATLKDSLLLADACNMTGLFYSNLDSNELAKKYFYKGITYIHQPPYPARYLSLTMPHHIYGNLSEVFVKMKQYDSALFCIHHSLSSAKKINQYRGIAIAYNNLGEIYFKQSKIDSSIQNTFLSNSIAVKNEDWDISLLNYSNLAACENFKHNAVSMESLIHKGYQLMNEKPEINILFKKYFLNNVLQIYRLNQDWKGMDKTYATLFNLDSIQKNINATQVQNIIRINNNIENRLLKSELNEISQKKELANTRLYIAILVIVLLTAVFLIYRYTYLQKLKLSSIRNTISQDLHDDVGASLSSLHIYSSVAEKLIDEKPEKAKEMLQQLTNDSMKIMENMGDIVWAMKPFEKSGQSLEARIKDYTSGLLTVKDIECNYLISDAVESQLKNIEKRKNILLITKEAINNIAKYSNATVVNISLILKNNELILKISDNGDGFVRTNDNGGNGLKNMKTRALQIGGVFELKSELQKGTIITCSFPITNISDSR